MAVQVTVAPFQHELLLPPALVPPLGVPPVAIDPPVAVPPEALPPVVALLPPTPGLPPLPPPVFSGVHPAAKTNRATAARMA